MKKSYSLSFFTCGWHYTYWLSKKPLEYIEGEYSLGEIIFEDGERSSNYIKYIHREDGPAITHSATDNTIVQNFWWFDGAYIENIHSQEEFEIWKKFRNFR